MKRFCFFFGAILFLIVFASPRLFSQAVASLDENELLMGDIGRLTIDVPLPSDSSAVEFPALKNALKEKKKYFSLLNDTVEVRVEHTQSIDNRDGKHWMRYNLQIQAFDSGRYELPPFNFVVQGKPVESNRIVLNVIPVKAKADDQIEPFSDVVPPFEINKADQSILDKEKRKNTIIWILVICAFLVAAFLIFMYARYLKTGRFLLTPKTLSPDAQALKALKKLNSQRLPQKGKTKEYYTRLTDILRSYLKKGFRVKTFEKTSSEILSQIEEDPLISSYYDPLKSIFQTADFVKFAKVNPSEEENERCMEEALDFIKNSSAAINEEGGEK